MPNRGFTLVEVILVLMIAGIVIALAVPSYERYLERSRLAESVAIIGDISRKIRQYETSKGALPDDLGAVDFGGKLDPWGRPYEFLNLRSMKGNGKARSDQKLAPLNSDYDLYSVGRDGVSEKSLGHASSRDDVVRARDGGFIGLASEFDP